MLSTVVHNISSRERTLSWCLEGVLSFVPRPWQKVGELRAKFMYVIATSSCTTSASGLVVKSNVAIVGPRVRFSAGALRYDVGGYHSRLSRGIPGFESQYRNYIFAALSFFTFCHLFLVIASSQCWLWWTSQLLKFNLFDIFHLVWCFLFSIVIHLRLE